MAATPPTLNSTQKKFLHLPTITLVDILEVYRKVRKRAAEEV